MREHYPKPKKRLFCGLGLTAMLISPAALPAADPIATNSFADGAVSCRGGEAVPELLALADWPLDKGDSQACPFGEGQGADLGPPIEIIHYQPIPTVLAAGCEVPAPRRLPADGIRRRLGGEAVALGSQALDEIRGGFEPPDSNLKFSFGIERAVYVNGQLVASTALNLKDLQGTSGAGVALGVTGNADASGLLVVQNGAGNAFHVQAGPNAFGTVIQNTLNNQQIQSVTTINAAVNSAQVLRAMSIQSAIQDGLVNSLRR